MYVVYRCSGNTLTLFYNPSSQERIKTDKIDEDGEIITESKHLKFGLEKYLEKVTDPFHRIKQF